MQRAAHPGHQGEIFLLPGRAVHENKCETTRLCAPITDDLHWRATEHGLYRIPIFSHPDPLQTPQPSPACRWADEAGPASTGCFYSAFSGRWGQSPVSGAPCAQDASSGENLLLSPVPFTFMVKEWEPFCYVACSLCCLPLGFSQGLAGLHSCS